MPRALTGIQPSGVPHLGNLKGMLEPALKLQETHEAFYFIASYHAMTTLKDPEALRRNQREAAMVWLAFGLDPERTSLFLQQDVPEVCELSWILSCHVHFGMLERAHAFKAARDAGKDINLGTFSYPVLMAADILIYDSTHVPVGQDQKQHVEMARDMAQAFNHHYGETFVIPAPLIREEVAVVPGLDGRKMSKSYGNDVSVLLSGKKLRKRLMQIVTDSLPLEAPKDPEACNVFALYKLFADPEKIAALDARYRGGNFGYGHAKQELFEVVEDALAGPQARYAELSADPGYVDDVLAAGAQKARCIAAETVGRVRRAVGLN
jgi:tryptophanyl-tRNA synthetase